MKRADYLTQLKWKAEGMQDAAGLIMRVFGAEAEPYADIIRAQAEKARALMKRVEESDKDEW